VSCRDAIIADLFLIQTAQNHFGIGTTLVMTLVAQDFILNLLKMI
jgi:hypothetical protein